MKRTSSLPSIEDVRRLLRRYLHVMEEIPGIGAAPCMMEVKSEKFRRNICKQAETTYA